MIFLKNLFIFKKNINMYNFLIKHLKENKKSAIYDDIYFEYDDIKEILYMQYSIDRIVIYNKLKDKLTFSHITKGNIFTSDKSYYIFYFSDGFSPIKVVNKYLRSEKIKLLKNVV